MINGHTFDIRYFKHETESLTVQKKFESSANDLAKNLGGSVTYMIRKVSGLNLRLEEAHVEF